MERRGITSFRSGTMTGTANTRDLMHIDAHHHLWRYSAEEFGWISDSMAVLRRDFLPADLERELTAANIDATIAVQARTTTQETEFLLECAARTDRIAGVVGWFPLAESASDRKQRTKTIIYAELERHTANPLLVGAREVAQGQPAGFFDQPDFNEGIRELTARELTYDILIYANQLEETIRFVDRHPNQRFILDHAAKPLIATHQLEPWRRHITELARRRNVACKLSGLITEAAWQCWTGDDLAPYIHTCVEAFTPARLLAGSDWPVCLVAGSYTRWWQTLRDFFGTFSPNEQSAVFGGNALSLYRLPRRAHT